MLDFEGLRKFDVMFWSIWSGLEFVGCGVFKELDMGYVEIKLMWIVFVFLCRGVVLKMFYYLIEEVWWWGYWWLSLEMGVMDYFEFVRWLYLSFGFVVCVLFFMYVEDLNSVFMIKEF